VEGLEEEAEQVPREGVPDSGIDNGAKRQGKHGQNNAEAYALGP